MRTGQGLAVFFTYLPRRRDAARAQPRTQWGTVLAGQIALTRGGEGQLFRPGESCVIEADVVHSARVAAGSVVLDVFEEADRYPVRA